MAALFLRALTTACVVSVLLAVLLFPARQWMVRRYAPQVRWGLWCGMAALLLLGVCFSGMAAVPETVWNVPDYTVTLPAQGSPAVGQAAPQAAPSPAETAPSVSPRRAGNLPKYRFGRGRPPTDGGTASQAHRIPDRRRRRPLADGCCLHRGPAGDPEH